MLAETLLFNPKNLVDEDERRAIYELNCPQEGFSLQGFIVKTRLPLGKHAHGQKHELFKIVSGNGVVLTEQMSREPEGIVPIKERIQTELSSGSTVHVPPLTAHTFYLEPGSTMICFSSEPFDDGRKDMIPANDLVLAEA